MKKSKVIFLALLACAFGASAENVGELNGTPYDSLDKMIEAAQGIDAEIIMYTNATLSTYLDVTTNCVIRGKDAQCVISPSVAAGFRISGDGSLTISNLVFRGFEGSKHGFISVDGGELTLENGATLDGIVGNGDRGSGVVDLNKGKMTMKSGASIINCSAMGSEGLGGAICVCGSGCTLNLQGGVISNCYASTYGGGIYAFGGGDDAGINLSGDLMIADNRSGDDKRADDLYMYNEDALAGLKLVGVVSGKVGIRYSSSAKFGNGEGDAFMTNAVGVAAAPAFFNDTDDALTAVSGENGMLVWAKKAVGDGQCAPNLASAHVYYPDNTEKHYADLVAAIAYMTNGTTARIEMYKEGLASAKLSDSLVFPAGCQLTLTARNAGFSFDRIGSASVTIPATTSLTLTNVIFIRTQELDGVSVAESLFNVRGGLLTLADGACVSNIIGNASRDAAAIVVHEGGTVTMGSGSRIFGCQNTTNYDMAFETDVNYGCGGGILVDNGTAYLEGGEIANCLATRGGGVYACNGSTVRVSGNMRITGNRWQKANGDQPAGNVYISDNSELCMDGPLAGKVGKGAEFYVDGDTNLVATVGYAWTNDVEVLMDSATNFVHDVTGETGVAVTNGTGALIVWSAAAKDGIYVAQDGTKYVAISLGEHTPTTLGPLPELPSGGKDLIGVAAALTVSDLTDGAVYDAITGSNDPVSEYDTFRTWAKDVVGVDNVVKSKRACVSYGFGTTALLQNDPTIEITDIANADDGLSVSVVVKDGADPVAVASAKVKEMFEATSDLCDWTKEIELTVDDLTLSNATEVRFTVKPAGNPGQAFIRLKY